MNFGNLLLKFRPIDRLPGELESPSGRYKRPV